MPTGKQSRYCITSHGWDFLGHTDAAFTQTNEAFACWSYTRLHIPRKYHMPITHHKRYDGCHYSYRLSVWSYHGRRTHATKERCWNGWFVTLGCSRVVDQATARTFWLSLSGRRYQAGGWKCYHEQLFIKRMYCCGGSNGDLLDIFPVTSCKQEGLWSVRLYPYVFTNAARNAENLYPWNRIEKYQSSDSGTWYTHVWKEVIINGKCVMNFYGKMLWRLCITRGSVYGENKGLMGFYETCHLSLLTCGWNTESRNRRALPDYYFSGLWKTK